ncbi:ras guanine nucleotide exchange factor Q isoform X2 [Drosophila mojavensis]|nr:ras guanine nucleotide exchange factor Q isoform X2 [Drosophila mojavensis]KRG03860.1 uncharacterized protein Dmoj_GI16901, isoform D [Drosophila mojavensis]
MMHSNNVLRPNGERSPSRISIYNYPEHLNPFNEEDNHKRLRFWNFSKSNEYSNRRSFSFGNFRDVWTFRSFNLKKKSSTLGIQKTSESPPLLRRNLDLTKSYLHSGGYNYNKRRPLMRSLQNVSDSTDITTSEINGSPNYHGDAYFNRCSLPQPQKCQTIRSSHSSLSSTNPFESEIESDINNINGSQLSLRTKTYRKKRKAPSAPTKIMITVPQTNPVQEKSIDSVHNMEDIKSLTSAIERFVNYSNETSDNQLPILEATKDFENRPSIPEETSLLINENTNRTVPQEHVCIASEENTKTISVPKRKNLSVRSSLSGKSNISSQEHILDAEKEILNENNVSSENDSLIDYNLLKIKNPNSNIHTEELNSVIRKGTPDKNSLSNKNHLTVEHVLGTGDYISNESKSKSVQTMKGVKEIPNDNMEEYIAASNESVNVHASDEASTSRNNISTYIRLKTKANSLEFTEPTKEQTITVHNLLRPDNNNYNICHEEHVLKTKGDHPNVDASQNVEVFENYEMINKEIKLTMAKQSLPTIKRESYISFDNKIYKNNNIQNSEYLNNPLTIIEKSEGNIDLQGAVKSAKVKSVKDIIDSINRSQRLLKESAAKGTVQYSTALYSTNSMPSNKNHNKSKAIKNDISASSTSFENHLDFKQGFRKNKIDKIMFQCRESSPTASNLDWNPVPKPKRINSSISNDINEL